MSFIARDGYYGGPFSSGQSSLVLAANQYGYSATTRAGMSIVVMVSGFHNYAIWDNAGTVYTFSTVQRGENRVILAIGNPPAGLASVTVYWQSLGPNAGYDHDDLAAAWLFPVPVSVNGIYEQNGPGLIAGEPPYTMFDNQVDIISMQAASSFYTHPANILASFNNNADGPFRSAICTRTNSSQEGPLWTKNSGVAINFTYFRWALSLSLLASFTATPRSGSAPLNVQFADTTYTGPFITISQRLWDFGDNSTSTQANPLKTYSAAGTYSVKLTVWYGSQSSYVTEIGYITVGAGGPPTGVPSPDGPTAEGGVGALAGPMPGTPMFALGARAEVMAPFESVLNLTPRSRTVPLPSAGLENSSHARAIRALAKLQRGLVFGGFLRKKQDDEDEEQEWEALTVGLGDEFREPDRYDDESVGARVGMLWTQRVENGPMRIWVCTSTLVGQAKWWRIMLDDDGAKGSFP